MKHDAHLADFAPFLDAVDDFSRDRVVPAATAIEAEDRWFPELLAECAGLGLQGIMIDDDLALDATRMHVAQATTEILASYSPSVALGVGTARIHSVLLAAFGSPELKERWLAPLMEAKVFGSIGISEPEAGSDVRNMRTVASPDGAGGYVLNGTKRWITLAPIADFTIVLAKVGSGERDAGMAMMVVDTDSPGVTVGANESLISYRGIPNSDLYFDDVVVPADQVLTSSEGLKGVLAGLNFARIEAASLGVGMMRGVLRVATAYARDRVAFEVPIARHQAVQLRLGTIAIRHEAARGLVRRAADGYATGKVDPGLCAMAKVFATDAAMESATEGVSLLGGMGVTTNFAMERFFRDAKATQIFDGTSDLLTLMVGERAAARTDW